MPKRPRNLQSLSPDAAVLTQLHRLGSNLSKTHHIDFFLYFPTQLNAEFAKAELITSGFSVEIEKSAKGSDWLCLASKEMIPLRTELIALRKKLSELASKLDGEYDGWETQVSSDDITSAS